jgi:hypothetical protein
MTGLQGFWNFVFVFDVVEGVDIFDFDFKAISFQVRSPVIAAASSRQLVDRHQPFRGLFSSAGTGS